MTLRKEFVPLSLAAICNIPDPIGAQSPPAIEWQKALGGSAHEWAYAIQQTNDDGFIVCGETTSNDGDVTGNHGIADAWVVKLDPMGAIEWQHALGGSYIDHAYAVRQTTDGGYIMAGETRSNDGDVSGNHGASDLWVVKLDPTGNIQWQRTLGGSQSESAQDIIETHDGGYLAAGYTQSGDGDVIGFHGAMDAWVVKLDMSGNVQWQNALGGTLQETFTSALEIPLVGYVVAGQTYSNDGDVGSNHGANDAWVVQLDLAGTLQWEHTYGGSGGDGFGSILRTSDGGFAALGYSSSNNGDVSGWHGALDAWAAKLDGVGSLQWQTCLGGSDTDIGRSIWKTADDGYVLTAYSLSDDGDINGNHGAADVWVARLDISGVLLWQLALGGSLGDEGASIEQTADGGYAVAGRAASDDGDVMGNHGADDAWIVKLHSDDVGLMETTHATFSMHPNPGTDVVAVELPSPVRYAHLILTDPIGGEVFRHMFSGASLTLDLSDQPRGLYLVTILTETGFSSRRLVLERAGK